ncbi:MAG: hypothetical protein UU46_C0039G0004 [Candidatus Uhrbacteria bacterium GW2011_GWD1_41_16]|uniref:Uncharacterized protein n=1 Tax=Candidatus Uhrbacteria bacterium GW2011_GWC1_41_20 TaxID=1618983 RepID=A0A0G0YAX8_9BACT|nr:MAG: hypothetical protein UT52_C0029G0005 [Candidatus Uhrbacteria bacterium GW2011_GWE1_39_46]KKR63070.1 MAG: hypothetical protein UU04_C0028G0001 [Candidatus Uhrbacteria bacterium GW2011_GWC2_40_450]KKR88376.1 MAG: hypothetical protein UU36_C0045G0005 [Candidatus Uhrbacteria bacterium GW2011_GWE2_41_1153]KKR94118.1 MAG: hypothetical protein UU46_C0039G0004 [Candidatus Uhrbacteria bacterium GW2011_GWD1_41_16]KKR97467.1 MAG: hypothetical protein UU50_C0030G0005 [Candidatus Uhrbacteria bacteri
MSEIRGRGPSEVEVKPRTETIEAQQLQSCMGSLNSRERVHTLSEGARFLLEEGKEDDFNATIHKASQIILGDIETNRREYKSWQDYQIRKEIQKLGETLGKLGRWEDLKSLFQSLQEHYGDDFSDDSKRHGMNTSPLRELVSALTGSALEANDSDAIKWLKEEVFPKLYSYPWGREFEPAPYKVLKHELISSSVEDFEKGVAKLPTTESGRLRLERAIQSGDLEVAEQIIEDNSFRFSDLDKTDAYIRMATATHEQDRAKFLEKALDLVEGRLGGNFIPYEQLVNIADLVGQSDPSESKKLFDLFKKEYPHIFSGPNGGVRIWGDMIRSKASMNLNYKDDIAKMEEMALRQEEIVENFDKKRPLKIGAGRQIRSLLILARLKFDLGIQSGIDAVAKAIEVYRNQLEEFQDQNRVDDYTKEKRRIQYLDGGDELRSTIRDANWSARDIAKTLMDFGKSADAKQFADDMANSPSKADALYYIMAKSK